MIITHKLNWDKCLSHQIWPAIEKGWKDEDRPIHFFWGLAGGNIGEIRKCIEKKEEYWFVDTGYITKQIHRYPEPKILDEKRTYFRICKGSFHTNKGKVNTPARLDKLRRLGIDAEFKGWRADDRGKHILLCPSSPTVTFQMNGITQDEWVEVAKREIRKHTDREIRFRNKPRPGNQWWNTDIKDDLKNAWCVVTNMSLSAIDGILNMTPVFAHKRNITSFICGDHIGKITKPMRPGHKTVNEWLKMVVDNQFKLSEIEDGTAYKLLMNQPNNLLKPEQIQEQVKI